MGSIGILLSILILGFIVFIHELGHFVFAKAFKVPVREFSIGMGKRLISFVKNNTRYSLKLLPIGGSCAMVGEDIAGSGDFSAIGGVVDNEKKTITFDGVTFPLDYVEKNNFSVISAWKKVVICFAGPLFNFLLAMICGIVLVLYSGVDLPIISVVKDDGAASKAAPYTLNVGDEILRLETPFDKKDIVFSKDVVIFLAMHNEDFIELKHPLGVVFKRDNEIHKTIIFPSLTDDIDRAVIGISIGKQYYPDNIIDIVKYSVCEGIAYIDLTIKGLKFLFSGKINTNEMSGPVGTVAVMGQAINNVSSNFSAVFVTILMLVNMISANLGVMNLLPIPALDGGRIIESVIEMIIGRPLDAKIQGFVNAVSMVFLLLLMLYIFGLDLYKIFTGTLFK